METLYGHRYHIETPPSDHMDEALNDILKFEPPLFDRYRNPFEDKLTLRDKWSLPAGLKNLVRQMEGDVERIARLFEVPTLSIDANRHYCGVFKYEKGGRLGVHVDAGIHPKTRLRKHITAVLYLGRARDGSLELWRGDSCDKKQPKVEGCFQEIRPSHGLQVLFENNDYAWHGMSTYEGEEPRVVVTVSYLSEAINEFSNKRQRAFFVPRPDEPWDEETYRLRDMRADNKQFAEVYRS